MYKFPSISFIFYEIKKAGDGNRTHVSSLEGWCSTIELHPRMSYKIAVRLTTKYILYDFPANVNPLFYFFA